MVSPEPATPDLKRLQQLELEIDQASHPPAIGSEGSRPAGLLQRLLTWSRPFGILLLLVACILTVGFGLKLLGEAFKLALIVGLGYLLFRYGVGPRFGLFQPAPQVNPDADNSLDP